MKNLILVLFLSLSLFAHNHNKKEVQIKTKALNNGIYMLKGQGGNIGLSIGKDGIFMIDDQFAPLSKKIKESISKLSSKKIKFLVNTHWHFDHVGGNENFTKDGALIISHENVRKRMEKGGIIKAFNKTIPPAQKNALPIVTFKNSLKFYFNGDEIEVIHRKNSHTDGDSIIIFKKANVIHTGDIYFNGFYPFIDASSKGNIKGLIKSVNYILRKANKKTKIIPGHGELSNKKQLKEYRDMLITVSEKMEKLKKEGKSLSQIKKLKPNEKLDKKWGQGFLSPEKFLEVLYSAIK